MAKITKDYVDNFGKPPLSPWISGEQITRTSALIQGAAQKNENATPNGNVIWDEPEIHAPERSMNTVVFQSKNGGNSIVINDEGSDGEGYMVITHKSGSVIQIDENGNVFVKSFGDRYDTSEGYEFSRCAGDSYKNIGGEWNVMVESGSGNVFINGDLNLECENFNLTARAKATINAGEGIQMKGAKFSMEAHSDNFDLIAKDIKISSSESFNVIAGEDINLTTSQNVNMKASQEIRIDATQELKGKGSNVRIYGATVYLDDVVRMAEAGASTTGVEDAIKASVVELSDPPSRRLSTDRNNEIVKIQPTPGGISGRDLDDEGEIV